MKIKKLLVITIVVALLALLLFACNSQSKTPLVLTDSEDLIVLQPTEEYVGQTVLEFMDALKSNGALDFVLNNGMIISVNGKEQSLSDNNYWMIYTNDENHSNTAWGTAEYKGTIYGSADNGVSSLVIAEHCIYLLAYQHITY